MATLGSIQPIFEKPSPDPPTLLRALSRWQQMNNSSSSSSSSTAPINQDSSFTEIFGELHFNQTHHESSSPSSPTSSLVLQNNDAVTQSLPSDSLRPAHRNSDSFSSMNSESLQLCTEGLGSESFDDVEDLKSTGWESHDGWIHTIKNEIYVNPGAEYLRRSRSIGGKFPPPISSIDGMSGKPWVSFKSYRHGGRFVLKEIRVPTQEFLHASREDGRLKLQFVQSDDEYEFLGQEEEDEGGEENYNDGEKEEESGGEGMNAQLASSGNGCGGS